MEFCYRSLFGEKKCTKGFRRFPPANDGVAYLPKVPWGGGSGGGVCVGGGGGGRWLLILYLKVLIGGG